MKSIKKEIITTEVELQEVIYNDIKATELLKNQLFAELETIEHNFQDFNVTPIEELGYILTILSGKEIENTLCFWYEEYQPNQIEILNVGYILENY